MQRVHGLLVDDQTRCVHYHQPTDVVALKFGCCRSYYPCFRCHEETAGHPAQVWPASGFDEPAVLCGVCGTEMTPHQYFAVTGCPHCGAAFNEGCRLHRHLYFEGQ